MGSKRYTEEQLNWLRENAPGKFLADILPLFNERFGLNITSSMLHAVMGNHKIKSGMIHKNRPESRKCLTTPEMDQAVLETFHKKGTGSYKAVQAFLRDRFGLELTVTQIKGYASRIHLNMGVYGHFKKGHVPANKGKKVSEAVYKKCAPTMFKKGHLPKNWRPIGSERINIDGYIEVKVADPNVWMLKHRVIYEEATGEKLTSKDVIVFLDGNSQNVQFENLAKITNADLARLNQMHLINGDQETGRVGVLLAKLTTMAAKRERGERVCR